MTGMSLSRACFEAEEETKQCELISLPNQIPSSAVSLSAGPNRKKKVSTFLRAVLFTRVSAWTPRGIGRQPASNHAHHTPSSAGCASCYTPTSRPCLIFARYRQSHVQRFRESRRRGEIELGRLERWRRARMRVPDRSFGQFAIPLSDGNASQR